MSTLFFRCRFSPYFRGAFRRLILFPTNQKKVAPHLLIVLDMRKRITHNKTMNRLTSERRAAVINCLIEGCSIRSTVRMTGVAKKTVMRLVVEVGSFCAEYQDNAFRNLKCRRLQVDELWSFCYCKQKNVTNEISDKHVAGDAWLWSAIDADTKLVPCWYVGQRDAVASVVRNTASALASVRV